MSRRSRQQPTRVTILWRDIPAQVNAGSGAERVQRILPRRFQRSIDRAAMVAGKTRASDYVAEWRRVTAPLTGDPQADAEAEAGRLEAEFPLERLNEFVAAGGWDPSRPAHETLQSDGDESPRLPEESAP